MEQKLIKVLYQCNPQPILSSDHEHNAPTSLLHSWPPKNVKLVSEGLFGLWFDLRCQSRNAFAHVHMYIHGHKCCKQWQTMTPSLTAKVASISKFRQPKNLSVWEDSWYLIYAKGQQTWFYFSLLLPHPLKTIFTLTFESFFESISDVNRETGWWFFQMKSSDIISD